MPTPHIHISQDVIADLCRRHHIVRLALFGSVLRDDFRPDSDLDVLVEFEEGHTPGFAFAGMETELGELIGRKVDLRTPRDFSAKSREHLAETSLVRYDAF